VGLAGLSLMMWQTWITFVPEHQRNLYRMRVYESARRASLGAASWAGRRGIAVEASTGDEASARAWYETARWLASSAAGRAARAIEQARGIG
jgi:hypothetical protein